MELRVEKVKFTDKGVKKIYIDSFPKEERMPFFLMNMMAKMNSTDFLAFYDQDVLSGFIYAATIDHLTYILFFAVDQTLRSKGYGSSILEKIESIYPENKLIVSIERCDEESKDLFQRRRRKQFYSKNGYFETGYLIELAHTKQEILIKNGDFDEEEFQSFFQKYSNGTIKPKIWKK